MKIKDEITFVPVRDLVEFVGIKGTFQVEEKEMGSCEHCYFYDKFPIGFCREKKLYRYCMKCFRKDHKNIIFRLVDSFYELRFKPAMTIYTINPENEKVKDRFRGQQ